MNHLKSSISSLFFLFLSTLVFPQKSDTYKLDYSLVKERIGVEARIYLEDSALYMAGYGDKARKLPGYITNLKLTNSKNEPVAYRFVDSSKWVLEDVKPGDLVNLKYDLLLQHEKEDWAGGVDGIAYVREYGVMNSGRSLFVVNGKGKRDFMIDAVIPEGYRLSVPWVNSGEGNYSFRVPDLESLTESFLFAGTHEEILIERDSFGLKFVLGGESLLHQKDRIVTMANELLDYYIKLMGGIPVSPAGNSLEECMVIITENDNIDGEVIGNHISMFMDPEGDIQSQLIGWFIFAHEFFHLWNGKSIQFEGSKTDWFKEGFSNYYTLKGLKQVNFIDENAYLAIMDNLFYQRYINDPGLGSLSPVNSADGFSKDNHWGLIYGGGLFTGLAVDMEIRHKSQNLQSLDDLMRELFTEFAGKDTLVNNEILKERIRKYGFTGFEDFFASFLSGFETIHLQPYLKYTGAEVEQNEQHLKIEKLSERSELQQEIWTGMMGEID